MKTCHSGTTHFILFVRSKNLPFCIEDVEAVTSRCHICAIIKPQLFSPLTSGSLKLHNLLND